MLEFDLKAKVGAFELEATGRQSVARVGLFGPSGCGKTTLLNCLAGLLRPERGSIVLNGRTLFSSDAGLWVPAHRRRISYVFQDSRLFPHMSVRANIEYGRRRDGRSPGLGELGDVLDIEELLDRAPATLSAGESQRVALARALAAGPELLLLDEPLASLDAASRLRILPYLNRIHERWRVPFVYVSHALSEILFLAESSWEMAAGRILRAGAPEALLARGSHQVDPVLNIWRGTVENVPGQTGYAVVRSGGQRLKVPGDGLRAGDGMTLVLPARDLMLSLSPPRGLSARNALSARIRRLEQNGRALWVIAEAGSNRLVVELTEEAGRELGLRVGMGVYVVFKTHSLTVSRSAAMPAREEGAGGA